jgi:rRNA maturation RNase YbeY
MKVIVQGCLPRSTGLQKAELKNAATFFAEQSSRRIGVPFHEIVVFLGDDIHSDEMHRAIMGIEGATDVITQAYEAIPPEEPGIYGELFVNVDQARRVAKKSKRWNEAKELLLYVAHGMDHLSGADDYSEKEYRRMRRRELRWIREWLAGKDEK